jgi:hypothetical protein
MDLCVRDSTLDRQDVEKMKTQPLFQFGDRLVSGHGIRSLVYLDVTSIEWIEINADGSGEFKYNGSFWETELRKYEAPKILLQCLFYDSSLGVYMIPDGLFESESSARRYAEDTGWEFIRTINEITV